MTIDRKSLNIKVDAHGFVGKQCEVEINKVLEYLRMFGIEISVQREEKKLEYFVEESEQHTVTV